MNTGAQQFINEKPDFPIRQRCKSLPHLKQVAKILDSIETTRREKCLREVQNFWIIEKNENKQLNELWATGNYNDFLHTITTLYIHTLLHYIDRYKSIISQSVTSNEFYRNYYEGRLWLQGMLEELYYLWKCLCEISPQLDLNIDKAKHYLTAFICRTYFFLGMNYFYTEEEKAAEYRLKEHIRLWLTLPLTIRGLSSIWNVGDLWAKELTTSLNTLGFISYNSSRLSAGIGYLKRAQGLPSCSHNTCNSKKSENIETQTFYYLAQAYGTSGYPLLGAKYYAYTISCQLENIYSRIEQCLKEINQISQSGSSVEMKLFQKNGTLPESSSTDTPIDNSYISELIADTKESVQTLTKLSEFFESNMGFFTAQALLHLGECLVSKLIFLIQQMDLTHTVQTEIHGIKASIQRDISYLFGTRIKFSISLFESPSTTLNVLNDAILRSASFYPESVIVDDSNSCFNVSDTEFDCLNSYELPPVPALEIDTFQDLRFTLPLSTFIYDEWMPKTIDARDLELSTWMTLHENIIFTSNVNKQNVTVPTLCIGHLSVEIPLMEYFKEFGKEAIERSRKINVNIFKAEYSLSVPESNVTNSFIEQRCIFNPLQSYKTRLEYLTPALCVSYNGLQQLCTGLNHFVQVALSYFVLNGHVTNHVKLLLLRSAAYRQLTTIEEDPKRFAAFQTKRLNFLYPLLNELNPIHYNHFINQISFELGELCQELLSVKKTGTCPLKQAQCQDSSFNWEKHLTKKKLLDIENIRQKAIQFYNIFLESLKDNKEQLSDPLPDTLWNSYFAAQFAKLQLLSGATWAMNQGVPLISIVLTELTQALEISETIQKNAKKWGTHIDNAPCSPAQLEIAENMSKILSIEIYKIQSLLRYSNNYK